MRAVTWQGRRRIAVQEVPDPRIEEPSDAIVRITSTAICGSDLHLYELLGPFLDRGDVLGHEAIGVVVETGAQVRDLAPGDRVVVPFTIACGSCFMCVRGLQSQCETTQVRQYGAGAQLFGYTKMYGQVPGAQAELLRVPRADYNTIRVGRELPDERYLFLGDILSTAWQGVEYAQLPENGSTLAILGLGPVGQLVTTVAVHRGLRVLAVDPVPERRELAERHGAEVFDVSDELVAQLQDLTGGRGPDAVVDAVGMEAHGEPLVGLMQKAAGSLPGSLVRTAVERFGVDRLPALHTAVDLVRRGGTVSLSGVYAGNADILPMRTIFDKQLTLRGGQCNVKHWTEQLLPLAERADDPLRLGELVTHRTGLEEAPRMYEIFQRKAEGCIKVVMTP